MPSTIRPATKEDSKLAITLSEKMERDPSRSSASKGEQDYGFKVVNSNAGIGVVQVLMPSGYILVRDLLETGSALDSSLSKSEYKGDRSIDGELGRAVVYSSIIGRVYLKLQGLVRVP